MLALIIRLIQVFAAANWKKPKRGTLDDSIADALGEGVASQVLSTLLSS